MQATSHKPGQGAIIIFCVLMFVYFFCPVLYILPLVAVYGKRGNPPAPVLVCLKPVVYLEGHVPLYHTFLQREFDLVGLK